MRLLSSLSLLLLVLTACDDGFRSRGELDVRFCGNGRIDPGETCDDGNNATETCAAGDPSCTVCNSKCQEVPGATSVCGDGVLDGVHEDCDDGNTVTEACAYGQSCGVCDASCSRITITRYCGDGTIDPDGDERCDDGALNSDSAPDACRMDCQPATCGDGVVDATEACDPGSDPACRADCTPMRCGDGIVDPIEACDPASGAEDGCRENCVLPSCGDGLVDPGEDCDHGVFVPTELVGNDEGACTLDGDGGVRCYGGTGALRDVPAALAEGARSLTVGRGWACALTDANKPICWGEEGVGPQHPVLTPPAGSFSDVAAGDGHACGIIQGGVVLCWGRFDARPSLEVAWAEVVSGRGFTCARRGTGSVGCWGASTFDVSSAPSGKYAALAAGRRHACALREADGTVVCWGDERAWQLRLPTDPLRALALGDTQSCGLDLQGEIVCWGEGAGELQQLPAGPFDSLASIGDTICGLRADLIACIGDGAAVLDTNADTLPGSCRADCTAPRCGDGVVDPGEACDDGNTTDDGNGCSATCERVGTCGDGIVQAAFETCDEGDAVREPCPDGTSCEVCAETCTMEAGVVQACGNSRLDPGEACDDGATGARFRSLSLGGGYACGLLEDGRVRCFGDETLPDPPQGEIQQVQAGEAFACALQASGAIECWGSLAAPTGDPARRFVAVDAGPTGACALDDEGRLLCWGAIQPPPAGAGWREVSVGRHAACALDGQGAITCWGAGVQALPGDGFTRISVGGSHLCAVDARGYAQCAGTGFAGVPQVRVADISSGDGLSCVIDVAGTASCFGPAATLRGTSLYRGVSVAGPWACAVREDGLAGCWGDGVIQPPRNGNHDGTVCRDSCMRPTCGDTVRDPDEACDHGIADGYYDVCEYEAVCSVCSVLCTGIQGYGPYCGDAMVYPHLEQCDDGDGRALAIGRGADFTCIVTTGGAPRCWGVDSDGQSAPPMNAFTDLAAGGRHACGLDRAGAPFCWGADDHGQAQPPRRAFTSLAAGRAFTCGLTPAGGIVCWGDVPFTPPATAGYEQIGAGDRHLCALSASGAIACWGANDAGQAAPPAGSFDTIAVGTNHGCALAGETALCWGDDAAGQANPPAGLRAATPLAAGNSYSCATDALTGVLHCWGLPPAGGPTGPLDQLALSRWGHDFACGRSAVAPGRIQCWGSPGVPEATPPLINSDVRPDACRTDCFPARCGDGVVDTGEACDDGNAVGGDGCSASCSIE